MFTITSKNRTAAKRLLNTWHDSREVRLWTLGALQSALICAINEGLITEQGVMRVLAKRNAQESGESGDDARKTGDYAEGYKDAKDGKDANNDQQSGEYYNGHSDAVKDMEEQSDAESSDDSDDESEGGESAEQGEDEKESESEDKEEEQPDDYPAEDDDSPIEHHMMKCVLKYISAGLNVALVGPTGSGKSVLAAQVADKLDKPFSTNGAVLSKYDLVGFVDAGGTYHKTPLYTAYTEGGLHCADELDASAPDAVVAFNGMNDSQAMFTFPNGMQNKHADFIAVACMNTYGNGASADYVGRYKQDAAAMSRYVRVFIGYDKAIEKRCGPRDIVERVWAIREACEALGIRHIVSTRQIAQAHAARSIGKATKAEIDRDIFFAGLDDSAITQIKSAMKSGKDDKLTPYEQIHGKSS